MSLWKTFISVRSARLTSCWIPPSNETMCSGSRSGFGSPGMGPWKTTLPNSSNRLGARKARPADVRTRVVGVRAYSSDTFGEPTDPNSECWS